MDLLIFVWYTYSVWIGALGSLDGRGLKQKPAINRGVSHDRGTGKGQLQHEM